MSCLGVHLALSMEEANYLLSCEDEHERLEYVTEELEERYLADPGTYAAQSDKAWDGMHRALSDGLLTYDGGEYPLNHVVLAGKVLYSQDDYIMSLKTPEQVSVIASALETLTEEDFRHRYDAIDAKKYDDEIGDEDFQYTWGWLQEVRRLYRTAAAEGRHVLFTADQ